MNASVVEWIATSAAALFGSNQGGWGEGGINKTANSVVARRYCINDVTTPHTRQTRPEFYWLQNGIVMGPRFKTLASRKKINKTRGFSHHDLSATLVSKLILSATQESPVVSLIGDYPLDLFVYLWCKRMVELTATYTFGHQAAAAGFLPFRNTF